MIGKKLYLTILGYVEAKCPKCSSEENLNYIKEKYYIGTKNVDFFSYKTRYIVVCPECKSYKIVDGNLKYRKIEEKIMSRVSLIKKLKQKLEEGEITMNEYKRMMNTL